MDLDVKIMRHPTRQQLVAFAESLVDRRAPVSAAYAAHVSSCKACTTEVREIRASLEFTSAAPALEPSTNLTAQILLEAKKARQEQRQAQRRPHVMLQVCKGLACAASVAIIAGLTFSSVLAAPDTAPLREAALANPVTPSSEYAEAALERASTEISSFSSAVRLDGHPQTLQELERLRDVRAIGADLAAAKAALERNPGCVRATHIVNANIQRGAATLRELYVEQTF